MNSKINITLTVLCTFAIIAIVVINFFPKFCFPCSLDGYFCRKINDIIVNLSYNIIGGCIIYYLTVITIQRAKRKQYKYFMYNNYRQMCNAIRECSNCIIGDSFSTMSELTLIATKNEYEEYVISTENSNHLHDMHSKLSNIVCRALEYEDFLSEEENNLLHDSYDSFILNQIAENSDSSQTEIWSHKNLCEAWIEGLKALESNAEVLKKIGLSYIKKNSKSQRL